MNKNIMPLLAMYLGMGESMPSALDPFPRQRRSGNAKTRIGFQLEKPGKPVGGNANKKNPVRKANKKRKAKRGYR